MPRELWRRDGRISSSKSVPQIEVLTFAEADAGEPVWTMKVGRERWKGEESYAEEAQRARKFWRPLATSVKSSIGMQELVCRRLVAGHSGLTSAVLGTDSQKSSILMSPRVVWRVTDIAGDKQLLFSAHHAAEKALTSSTKMIEGGESVRPRGL